MDRLLAITGCTILLFGCAGVSGTTPVSHTAYVAGFAPYEHQGSGITSVRGASSMLPRSRTAPSCQWQVFKPESPWKYAFLTSIVAIASNDVWAVGSYTRVGHGHSGFFHFDGSSWTMVQTPNIPEFASIDALAASSSSNVWGVGILTPRKGSQSALIVHWDGSAWTAVQHPGQTAALDLWSVAAIGSSYAVAVGYGNHGGAFIEHYDGSAWVADSITPGHQPQAVAGKSLGSLWAGGTGKGFLRDQSSSVWDFWPARHYHNVISMSARSDTEVWAASQQGSTLLERWDGSAWRGVPFPFGGVYGLGQIDATNANGYTWVTALVGGTYSVVYRHDGRKWTNMQLPLAGSYTDVPFLAAVPGSSDVWVAGQYAQTRSANRRNLLERWTCI
jgi:hypothetical protein